MELSKDYELTFEPNWNRHLLKFDKTRQETIFRKILSLQTAVCGRHLRHGFPFFVAEVGGCRIVYRSDDFSRTRKIVFVGDHKQYEKWYGTR